MWQHIRAPLADSNYTLLFSTFAPRRYVNRHNRVSFGSSDFNLGREGLGQRENLMPTERPLLQIGHHLLDGCLADDTASKGTHQLPELELHCIFCNQLLLGLKPMIEVPTVGSSFLLPELIGALTNTL
jgi:hypothetical protein